MAAGARFSSGVHANCCHWRCTALLLYLPTSFTKSPVTLRWFFKSPLHMGLLLCVLYQWESTVLLKLATVLLLWTLQGGISAVLLKTAAVNSQTRLLPSEFPAFSSERLIEICLRFYLSYGGLPGCIRCISSVQTPETMNRSLVHFFKANRSIF